MLARSIGVHRLIVAVNKMDSVSWSKARFEEIRTQMTAFLTKQGFRPDSLAFIPCAGLTGGNILNKPTEDGAKWYIGHTLVEELDASEPASRSIEKPLRMTINDIFRGGVQNPLSVSGRIEQGNLQVGDQILAVPAGEKAFIKAIDIDDEPADWAVAGQIPTLHLQDIDPIHLRQGDVLCSSTSPLVTISKMTLKLLTFQHVMPQYVDVLRGRLMVEGKISKLVGILDKATFEVVKKKPRVLQPESVARVRVEMEKAVPLEVGSRVILRAEGQTLGAGIVEEVG
jgi:elongation factor 1 alpha-like protein